MHAKNCPRCGKLFNEIKSPICPACERTEDDDFHRVKEYIEENHMCTLQEISDATGVGGNKIIRYIKDGRLEISGGMSGEVRCETCGKPVSRGRFCDKCLIELNRGIHAMFGKDGHIDESERGARKDGKMYSSLMKKRL